MNPRNCGYCQACGAGNYDACTTFPVAVQEEGDAKDAARYRWLRDRPLDWSVQHERNGWSTCYGRKELDAQIDSAMKGDQP